MRETIEQAEKRHYKTRGAHNRIPGGNEPTALVVESYELADKPGDMHTYSLTLRLDGREMQTSFRAGIGHTEPPTLMGVLYCLALDAQAGQMTHAEWCAECGYDEDSRSALETYLQCQKVAHDLVRWARTSVDNLGIITSAWDSDEDMDKNTHPELESLYRKLKTASTVRRR